MASKRRRDVNEYTDSESDDDIDIHSFQRNFGEDENFELSVDDVAADESAESDVSLDFSVLF
jgi:hypothetical protein